MAPGARRRVVAIHQPTFFPWLGYFNKIAYADIFIILDSVPFSKTGGTWLNRVRLMLNGRASWVTMPVVRAYHGVRLVRDMKINGASWRSKLLQTLRSAYGRAPHFRMVFPFLAELINNRTGSLADYNFAAIRALTVSLGLHPARFIVASTLGIDGGGTDLLVDIVRSVGGTVYLSGDGANYQEDHKFATAGIGLVYQKFQHPIYCQRGAREFAAGLSIVDALMNCGFEETRDLVLSSRPSLTSGSICEVR